MKAQMQELDNKILGVEFKSLVSHGDERGFFREIIRETDSIFTNSTTNNNPPSFAQWSHSKMAKNTVKAWHYHHLQTDWWYLGLGLAEVVLIDNRDESPTKGKKLEFLLSGESSDGGHQVVVKIPPGVLHGCKVISEVAHLFYITSKSYDPNDEGRFAYNSSAFSHNWGDEKVLIVAENDKRDFIPKYPRTI